jgi:hypothetical protein
MNLKELMDFVVVVKLSTTLLKMLNPVETCVLDPWRKILLYYTRASISNKRTRSAYSTNVLSEGRHKLDGVTG